MPNKPLADLPLIVDYERTAVIRSAVRRSLFLKKLRDALKLALTTAERCREITTWLQQPENHG